MDLIEKFKDWNLKRSYSNLGVALANIVADPISKDRDPFFYFMIEKMSEDYQKIEAKYLEAGYAPVNFLEERIKKGKPISRKSVGRLN